MTLACFATKNWPRVTLADVVVETQYGTSQRANDKTLGVPVLRMNNLTPDGKIDLSSLKHVCLENSCLDRYTVKPGDILFNRTNSPDLVGKMAVWDRPDAFAFAGYLVRVRVDARRVDPRFVARWFNTPEMKAQLRMRAKPSINMSNISASEILKFHLPLPDLAEQRRACDILDRANELSAARAESEKLLRALRASIFVDMFGDPALNPRQFPCSRLGDMAVRFSDGPFGSNLKSSHYVECGVRVVRLQNIGVSAFLDADRAFISQAHFATLRKHECLPGDVLVGTLGDPNLRACVQPSWLSVALNKADCVQVRPDPSVATAAYLCGLLNHPSTGRMALRVIHGQTRQRISMGSLRELVVPVPPIVLQREFEQRLAKLECCDALHRRAVGLTAELLDSLQHCAFYGEL